jgi:hypothetical protein
MRLALFFIVILLIVLGWYSWFFRYEPVQNGVFLDRWRGDAINIQGLVVNLNKYRQAVFSRRELASQKSPSQAFSSREHSDLNGKTMQKKSSSVITPEEHLNYIRQMLQEGQGLPGQTP